jgi:hypothetical protein
MATEEEWHNIREKLLQQVQARIFYANVNTPHKNRSL